MFNFLSFIFSNENEEVGQSREKHSAYLLSLFFAVMSAILTCLNIWRRYTFMAVLTLILSIGFLCAAHFSKKGNLSISHAIIVLLCAVIFSVFALIGGNHGFAILWILLIPLISYMLIGLKSGFILSAYFQLFLILLFYTPLSGFVRDYYTPTFIVRYPLLYCAAFVSVTVLIVQRQKLYNTVRRQAYYDPMTNLYGRRMYNEILEEQKREGTSPALSVVAFDLNRLKFYNDTVGHEAGDEIIRAAAQLIQEAFHGDCCFRTGGDEFSVFSSRRPEELNRSLADLQRSMKAWKGLLVPEINISAGTAYIQENPGLTFEELCRLADQRMYAEKDRYYRERGYDRRCPR